MPPRDNGITSFLPAFRKDIRGVLAWSEQQFGPSTADRYAALIRQALRDLMEDPRRPGAKSRPELAPDAYVYHLSFSRNRVPAERVKGPRHFILYRFSDRRLEFARLLHDRRDLERHLYPDFLAH